MRSYKVIVSKEALSDLDSIAAYVAGLYRPSSGHKYVNRILGQIASLAFTAVFIDSMVLPLLKPFIHKRRRFLL